jgi:hypothetical protein
MGNSITQGKVGLKADSSYEFSYRPWLWGKLIRAGLKVDMVGFHPYFFDEKEGSLPMSFEVDAVPFDRDCEAYYGITSAGFVNGSPSTGWTGAALPKFSDRINDPAKGYTPDVALIHLGTNDPDSTAEQVRATRTNIGEVIRVLRVKNPSVVILVAQLITGWKKINTQIDGLCTEWTTPTSPVIPVDMASGFINDPTLAGTMTYDHVHPNKAGQWWMMERWYNAIVQNLHDAVPPSMKGKPMVANKAGGEVSLSWSAADDNYGIKSYDIFVDGKLVASTNQSKLTYTLKTLRKGHRYTVGIRAKDWSGNVSNQIVTAISLKNK